MYLREIRRILDAKVLCGEENLDWEAHAACASDFMSDVLAYVKDWTDEGGRPCLRGAEVPVFGFDEVERIAAFAVDFMDGEARRGGLEL